MDPAVRARGEDRSVGSEGRDNWRQGQGHGSQPICDFTQSQGGRRGDHWTFTEVLPTRALGTLSAPMVLEPLVGRKGDSGSKY